MSNFRMAGLIKAILRGALGFFEIGKARSHQMGACRQSALLCFGRFPAAARQQEYQIDVGDVIEILVARVPEAAGVVFRCEIGWQHFISNCSARSR